MGRLIGCPRVNDEVVDEVADELSTAGGGLFRWRVTSLT
jgi:hypothetical protein